MAYVTVSFSRNSSRHLLRKPLLYPSELRGHDRRVACAARGCARPARHERASEHADVLERGRIDDGNMMMAGNRCVDLAERWHGTHASHPGAGRPQCPRPFDPEHRTRATRRDSCARGRAGRRPCRCTGSRNAARTPQAGHRPPSRELGSRRALSSRPLLQAQRRARGRPECVRGRSFAVSASRVPERRT